MNYEDPNIGYQRGDVVCCYPGSENERYGVIVAGPSEAYRMYRVRVSTSSRHAYVELGVKRENLRLEQRQ